MVLGTVLFKALAGLPNQSWLKHTAKTGPTAQPVYQSHYIIVLGHEWLDVSRTALALLYLSKFSHKLVFLELKFSISSCHKLKFA